LVTETILRKSGAKKIFGKSFIRHTKGFPKTLKHNKRETMKIKQFALSAISFLFILILLIAAGESTQAALPAAQQAALPAAEYVYIPQGKIPNEYLSTRYMQSFRQWAETTSWSNKISIEQAHALHQLALSAEQELQNRKVEVSTLDQNGYYMVRIIPLWVAIAMIVAILLGAFSGKVYRLSKTARRRAEDVVYNITTKTSSLMGRFTLKKWFLRKRASAEAAVYKLGANALGLASAFGGLILVVCAVAYTSFNN
jgi:hypothetical protein